MERPEWMSAPPRLATDRVATDSVVASTVERAEVHVSAAKDMADAGHLASALQETKQTVAFQARALVDAGIAENIAEGMARVVEDMEPAYAYLVAQEKQTVQRFGCEFLLAIWPNFAEMIRRGDAKLKIDAFPPENWAKPKVGLAIAFETASKTLSYSMNMERWTVSFQFTDAANPEPLLFTKVVEAARINK
jgi:hypothetical protein